MEGALAVAMVVRFVACPLRRQHPLTTPTSIMMTALAQEMKRPPALAARSFFTRPLDTSGLEGDDARMPHRVILEEEDGNGVGIYENVPVPSRGDVVSSEGVTFVVLSVLHAYTPDFDSVSVTVRREPSPEESARRDQNVFDQFSDAGRSSASRSFKS